MRRFRYFLSIVLCLLVLSLAGCQAPVSDDPSGDADIVVEVNGSNYAFSPNTISVRTGQIVRIELTSRAGTHDWVVDEFNAATAIAGVGRTVAVEFLADKAGEFEFYCSVYNHRAMGMVGTLIVED